MSLLLRKLSLITLVSLLISTSSCVELERPFNPENKQPPNISDLNVINNSIINVIPTSGVSLHKGEQLADLVAKELQKQGFLTHYGTNYIGDLVLSSEFKHGKILWKLLETDGKSILQIKVNFLEKKQILMHAQIAAKKIANSLNSLDKLTTQNKNLIYLGILPIDGDLKAITEVLQNKLSSKIVSPNILISKNIIKAEFLISGSVYLAEKDNKLQLVIIDWTIMHANGEKIGTVTQQNWLSQNNIGKKLEDEAEIIVNNAVIPIRSILENTELQRNFPQRGN